MPERHTTIHDQEPGRLELVDRVAINTQPVHDAPEQRFVTTRLACGHEESQLRIVGEALDLTKEPWLQLTAE